VIQVDAFLAGVEPGEMRGPPTQRQAAEPPANGKHLSDDGGLLGRLMSGD